MNTFVKASMLALGASMATQAVHAQYNDGDMLLGFVGVNHDYVIDLGQIPTAANTQLGGAISMSTFNSVGPFEVGVVGGDQNNLIVYGTTLRTSQPRYDTLYDYNVAGTENAPARITDASIDTMAGMPSSVTQGVTPTSDNTPFGPYWSQVISQGVGESGTDFSNWGGFQKPMVSLSSQPVILDYWAITDNNNGLESWTYVGDILIDMTGSSPYVIWDEGIIPEPATYGLFAGVCLLTVALRRQFVGQNV